jgi:hypothetical protein
MRFLVLVFAPTGDASADVEASTGQVLEAMARYNRELVDAGVVLAADGLDPIRAGGRVLFQCDGPAIHDEPVSGGGPCLAGYWILECGSREEAIERVRRAPFNSGVNVEVLQVARDGLGRRVP